MKRKILFIFLIIVFAVPSYSQTNRIDTCRHLYSPIGDLYHFKDSINIPAGNVIDVNLIVDTLYHMWMSDVIIWLSKGTIRDTLIRHRGGGGDNMIHTKFNDSATIPISSGFPPFTGS